MHGAYWQLPVLIVLLLEEATICYIMLREISMSSPSQTEHNTHITELPSSFHINKLQTTANPFFPSYIYPSTYTKMTNSMDMSSLTNALNNMTIINAYQRPKGRITRNIPYEKELEAKKNGTYVNPYNAAQDRQHGEYCNNQGYKGPILIMYA